MKVVYDIFDFFCALKFDYSRGLSGAQASGPQPGSGTALPPAAFLRSAWKRREAKESTKEGALCCVAPPIGN